MTHSEASNTTDRLLDIEGELLAVDTQNPPGDTRALAAWIETFFEDLSIESQRVTTDPAKPNLVATIPGETDRMLLFNGHMDTVPFDTDEWTYDPLGERVDDRIYRRSATGSGDAKKFRHAGVPTVEFAFGTDTAHAVDEYTTVEALERLPAVFAEQSQ